MFESVSLIDNKNNGLNRYIPFTEDLNRVYADFSYNLKKNHEFERKFTSKSTITRRFNPIK
jgi:hypothetical protein